MENTRNRPAGTSTEQIDTTSNDSDKTFTVPNNKIWFMSLVRCKLSTTATVGNRQLMVRVYDSAGTQINRSGTLAIAASTSGTLYVDMTRNIITDTDGGRGEISGVKCPPLTADMYIRVLDSSVIDAAADDLEVQLLYQEVSV